MSYRKLFIKFTFQVMSNLNLHYERTCPKIKGEDENYFSLKFHQNLRFLSLSLSFFVSEEGKKTLDFRSKKSQVRILFPLLFLSLSDSPS